MQHPISPADLPAVREKFIRLAQGLAQRPREYIQAEQGRIVLLAMGATIGNLGNKILTQPVLQSLNSWGGMTLAALGVVGVMGLFGSVRQLHKHGPGYVYKGMNQTAWAYEDSFMQELGNETSFYGTYMPERINDDLGTIARDNPREFDKTINSLQHKVQTALDQDLAASVTDSNPALMINALSWGRYRHLDFLNKTWSAETLTTWMQRETTRQDSVFFRLIADEHDTATYRPHSVMLNTLNYRKVHEALADGVDEGLALACLRRGILDQSDVLIDHAYERTQDFKDEVRPARMETLVTDLTDSARCLFARSGFETPKPLQAVRNEMRERIHARCAAPHAR